jgi:predicted esterase
MSGTAFTDFRRRLFERYRAGDYTDAMEVARAAASAFPERDDQTTYWIACLEALQGDPDHALGVLTDGLDRGLWWAPEMLETDPDLAALRDDGRLAEVIANSEAARRQWRGTMPTAPIVRDLASGALRAVAILLHGRNETPEDMLDRWPAVRGVGVVAPRSSQPFGMRAGCWDDLAQAEADVARGVEAALKHSTAVDVPRILGGFSQGGALALILAMRRHLPGVVGVLVVAPSAGWALDQLGSEPFEAGGRRCALIVGERDPIAEACQRLAVRLRDGGADVRTEVVTGGGHEYPADFEDRVPPVLDWVLGVSEDTVA